MLPDKKSDVVLETLLAAHPGFVPAIRLSGRTVTSIHQLGRIVEELRGQGVKIEHDAQQGYRWLPTPERIVPSLVRHLLADHPFGGHLVHVPSCESTNDVLWIEIERGAEVGTVVTANRQTRGRGRMGKRWESTVGKDLLLSVAVPCDEIRNPALLTVWASVAVADMLVRREGLEAALKWPNDVIARGRKLGGVLAETRPGRVPAVVGIGINVLSTATDRPEELRGRAVSLCELEDRAWDRSFVLADILNALGLWWETFCSQGWQSIYSRWRELCSTIGRRVRLQHRDETIVGLVEDIDPAGRLIVRGAEGKRAVFSVSEITDLVLL